MKKLTLLLASSIAFMPMLHAQKKKVEEANKQLQKALGDDRANPEKSTADLLAAKTAIDLASADASTANNYEMLVTKANIYSVLQQQQQFKDSSFVNQGVDAFLAAYKVNPKILTEETATSLISNLAISSINKAFSYFNVGDYTNAETNFKNSITLLNTPFYETLKSQTWVDTVKTQALTMSGINKFFLQDYDGSIALLNELNAKYPQFSSDKVYVTLAQDYQAKKDDDQESKILEEGVSKFPESQNLQSLLGNLYIEKGETQKLVAIFQKMLDSDPKNPATNYKIALLYRDIATPKSDAINYTYDDNYKKAEQYYTAATQLAPDNQSYTYNFGVFYFNMGNAFGSISNNFDSKTAKGKTESAKFEKMAKDEFAKAEPLLNKSLTMYKPESATSEEKANYRNAIRALKFIYGQQGKADLEAKMTALLKQPNSKK